MPIVTSKNIYMGDTQHLYTFAPAVFIKVKKNKTCTKRKQKRGVRSSNLTAKWIWSQIKEKCKEDDEENSKNRNVYYAVYDLRHDVRNYVNCQIVDLRQKRRE